MAVDKKEKVESELSTTAESEIAEFQKHLNALYPKTWQARVLGPAQRKMEKDADVFTEAARNGWFRSYMLRVAGRYIAFDIGYQYRDVYVSSECGFDPEFANWGVGSILQQFILQDLYVADRPREFNLGFGDNEYKWEISTDVQDAYQAYVTKGGLSAWLIDGQRFLNQIESSARKLLHKTGLVTFARRIVKRK